MTFAYPHLLWLLALLPVLAFLKGRKGQSASVQYSSGEILKSLSLQRKARAGLFLASLRFLALALMIVALARPQIGRGNTEITASGIDIVLALDVSGSMQAEDVTLHGQPVTRMRAVKTMTRKFIDSRPGDRIGLVVFAGQPYLVSPLTLDHDWLQMNLDRIEVGMVAIDGTAIGSGLAASVNRLRDQPAKSKVVVLLTDGANNAGKVTPEIAAEAAKALGIKVYTICFGSGGEIMVRVKNRMGFDQMVPMQADIDEATLEKIAALTGGKFFRATDSDALENVFKQIDQLEKTVVKIKKFETYTEFFQWFLIPGLLILGLELLLAHTLLRRLP
ncbi:MAG: VWA domain-containing protein [Verrucomicrobiae bacterium]|nr:VWA domain-containing protein [Verrucomicrobiae bacterium]